MGRFIVYSIAAWCLAAFVWFLPPVQSWRAKQIEVVAIKHFESDHDGHGDHDHSLDQLYFPGEFADAETLFVDRAGRTVLRLGQDTIRVPLDTLDAATYDHPDRAYFGLSDSTGVVVEAMHFIDWLLDPDRINALAMLIMVVGNAVVGVWWKFKRKPQQ